MAGLHKRMVQIALSSFCRMEALSNCEVKVDAYAKTTYGY